MSMSDKDFAETIARAVKTYGSQMQMIVAIEELSELQKELTKCIRNGQMERSTLSKNARLAEEMADVSIMLYQLYYMAGNVDVVRDYMDKKLARLRHRMEAKVNEKWED